MVKVRSIRVGLGLSWPEQLVSVMDTMDNSESILRTSSPPALVKTVTKKRSENENDKKKNEEKN